jgi:hypothetical protein
LFFVFPSPCLCARYRVIIFSIENSIVVDRHLIVVDRHRFGVDWHRYYAEPDPDPAYRRFHANPDPVFYFHAAVL